ncbi:MAG: alkaline phosphatase family protein [Victivallales bacterium]|jgi:hypothetical protein|nr:alkaline phosphatase family protein [Victivallales bacterium]
MKNKIEIFLFIDALGWELVQAEHFLEKELPERKKMRMQFGYSCSAIPTILSGKTPSEHGHLSLFRYEPKHSPFKFFKLLHYIMLPRSLWNRGRVRNVLSRMVKKLYGYTGYFQLYRVPFDRIGMMDYCEKRDLFAADGIAPFENLYDVLKKSGLSFHISNWRKSEGENLAEGLRLVREEKCDFLFLYTAALDSLEHDCVGKPEILREKLAFYETKIRELLAEGKLHARDFRLTVISDHGMTPLSGTVDLRKSLEQTGLKFGRDYAACYDSTMLRVHFLKPESEAIIKDAVLPFANCGHWLTEQEERSFDIWREDRLFGDAFFLLNPGIQIIPSDMGGTPLAGMHGFDPADKDSNAAMLSNVSIPEDVNAVADYFRLMKSRIDELSGDMK